MDSFKTWKLHFSIAWLFKLSTVLEHCSLFRVQLVGSDKQLKYVLDFTPRRYMDPVDRFAPHTVRIFGVDPYSVYAYKSLLMWSDVFLESSHREYMLVVFRTPPWRVLWCPILGMRRKPISSEFSDSGSKEYISFQYWRTQSRVDIHFGSGRNCTAVQSAIWLGLGRQ